MAGNIERKPDQSPGFTLIELLVVVSIIALLVSILIPSLGKAKELVRGTACLANVRRLAMAGQLYLTENREIFPPVRIKYNPDGSVFVNHFGRTKPRWQWFFDQGVGPPIHPTLYGGSFGDAETRTMTNDYFTCPSLKGEHEYDIRNGAYGYNYQYLGDSRSVSAGRYTNYPVRESQVMRPSETVFLGDSRGGGPGHGGHSYTLDPPKLAASKQVTKFGPAAGEDGPIGHSPVEARHSGRGNVSFVDGHAESMTLTELGYEVDQSEIVVPGFGSNHLWSDSGTDE